MARPDYWQPSQRNRWWARLRVSWALLHWAKGDYWTGNQDATDIAGVPKPEIIDLYEWDEEECRNRAEVMTLVKDPVCSQTQDLREYIDLPERWWRDLRAALDKLATHKTDRSITSQENVTGRLLSFFGSAVDPIVTNWATAHGDMNWSNLTAPHLTLLDWESFGTAPAGYDAATLYCLSLRTPDIAKKVHETFSDFLDSPDGIRAQLYAIGRYLKRVEYGDFIDFADLLHRHANRVIDKFKIIR